MNLIAIAGQKRSGKTTSCEYIQSILDTKIFVYSFAEKLKRFCIDTLGLTREQVDGTEEQKNSLTPYLWDKIHPALREKYASGSTTLCGNMTARQVMQVQGEIQRTYFDREVWIKAVFSDIHRNEGLHKHSAVHLISDVRHENEVKWCSSEVKWFPEAKILIIFLGKRTNYDNADSEKDLFLIDWQKYGGHILDNTNMTIEEKNSEIEKILRSNGFGSFLKK